MVVDQPLIPAPLPLRFPFPPYANNVAEGTPPSAQVQARGEAAVMKLVTEPDDPAPY